MDKRDFQWFWFGMLQAVAIVGAIGAYWWVKPEATFLGVLSVLGIFALVVEFVIITIQSIVEL